MLLLWFLLLLQELLTRYVHSSNVFFILFHSFIHSRYCEVIGEAVVREPGQHRSGFVSQVLELATKLKYHDLHYQMGEGEMADMPDPQWLINLQAACQQARAQVSPYVTVHIYVS